MFLTTQQVTTLFNSFDLNRDKKIHYREFIDTLRNDFNEKRLATVKYAYEVLSSQGDMSVAWLETKYNAASHPRVRTRDKTAENVFNEFFDALRHRTARVVDEATFMDYYADLNACLPAEKDEYFIDIVLSTWGISQDSYITPQRVEELENIIFEKVRQRTHGADDEGKTIRKVFRHYDVNENGVLSLPEFTEVLVAYGCVFKENEISAIFTKYDHDGSGYLDYEEFSSFIALKGSGNNPNVNPVFAIK